MTSKAGNALKTVGKDIEEGSAALAVFADQGIKGERAGTLLTNTIFGLTENADKNAGRFKELGIQVFDAEGNMKNMSDIAGDVTQAFDGMSEEQKLAEISALGFTKQTREGVLALAGQGETLAEYEEALRNAGGTAEEVAGKQLMTLEGQLGLLTSSINVAGIDIGEKFKEPLIELLAVINPLVDIVAPKFIAFFDPLANGVGIVADKLGAFVDIIPQMQKGFEIAEDSGAGFAGVLEILKTAFERVFGEINIEEAFSGFADFAQQMRVSILEALPAIIEGLLEFLPQFVSFITETLIPTMLDNAKQIFVLLISTIQEVLPMIAEGITTLIPQLIESLAELLPEIIETILGFIPGLMDTALVLFTTILDALVEMIPQIIDTLVELLPNLISTLMDMLPDIISAGLDLFMGIIDALVETIPILLDAIVEAMPEITGQLIEMLPDIIEASLTLFFGIIDGLVKAIPDILEAVIEMIPEITGQLVDMLPDIIDASMELFFGVINGLIDATPDILEAVIGLIPKMAEALLDNTKELVTAAFELLTGLARGLINNAPEVIGNAMSSVGETVVNGFKSFLGIQSHSKVFEGLGGDVVDGLEKGLDGGKRLLASASVDMAQNLMVSSENVLTGRSSLPISAGSQGGTRASNGSSNIVINVNAGMGADGQRIGQQIVDEIIKFERTSGRVFARA